jgi:predicted TIM-barrel fold metal-dependent hydrolase
MIIDVHAHIWKGNYGAHGRALIESADRYGIDRIYVSGLGALDPDEEEIRDLNDHVFLLAKSDQRILGYCYVNPRLKSAVSELRRGVEELGMRGMKLWVSTFCDDPLVFPLAEQCAAYDIPVLVHAFHKSVGQLPYESVGENVANLAKRYPGVRFIMAHLGANGYRELKSVRRCENVWADFSGSMIRRDELDYAKAVIGVDRLLFGTDMVGAPFLIKLGQLEDSGFTQAEKEKVLYRNALRVFGAASGIPG